MVTFQIDDAELKGMGATLHREVLQGVGRAVRVALESGQRNAQGNAPRKSGALRQSIRLSNVRVVGTSATGRLAIGIAYGKHVVGGTAPHVIVPRRKKTLHWTAGGRSFFAKRVQHPGTQPNPFFANACRVVGRVLESGVDRAVDSAIAIVTK